MNRKMAKEAMAKMLFARMLKGEIIVVEYADEKKEEVRKYFPEHMAHMFGTDEIIEIIKCTMGCIHKQLSEEGRSNNDIDRENKIYQLWHGFSLVNGMRKYGRHGA